jgi:glycosyltransferase involved in cell wall biosynthesis
MRIGMILDNVFPPDDRVEKEALTLINNGHEVFLLSYSNSNQPKEENWKGIKIFRTDLKFNIGKKFVALLFIFPVYKWFWYSQINRFVKKHKIDILHVHDLPLCKPAIMVKKQWNIKLVCDMHEDFADWILNTPLYNKGIKKSLRYFQNWKAYEKECLRQCDLIIGVSELLIEKMIKDYNLDAAKVIYIPNTPDLSVFDIDNIDLSGNSNDNEFYTVIYSGMVDELRGLQYVIPLIPKIVEKIPNFRLLIVGSGRYLDNLKNLAVLDNVEKTVHFTGFQPIEKLATYIASSKVGIYPQKKYKGIDETIPTKLFQYCAMGIPVISSDHLLPREFITANNCGFLVNFEDSPEIFIDNIVYLYNNEDIREKMGLNGKEGVLQHYNWQATVKPLINYYSTV